MGLNQLEYKGKIDGSASYAKEFVVTRVDESKKLTNRGTSYHVSRTFVLTGLHWFSTVSSLYDEVSKKVFQARIFLLNIVTYFHIIIVSFINWDMLVLCLSFQ